MSRFADLVTRPRTLFTAVCGLLVCSVVSLSVFLLHEINLSREPLLFRNGQWGTHQINRATRKTQNALIAFAADPTNANKEVVSLQLDLFWGRYQDELAGHLFQVDGNAVDPSQLGTNLGPYFSKYQELLNRLDADLPELTVTIANQRVQDLEEFFDETHSVALDAAHTHHRLWNELTDTLERQVLVAGGILGGFVISCILLIGALRRMLINSEKLVTNLDESQRRMTRFAESASDWFWETGPDLRLTETNLHIPGDTETMWMDAQDRIGQRHEEFTNENTETAKWRSHFATIEARQPFRGFSYSIPDGAGGVRYVRVSGVPKFDADGTFQGYIGTGTDETEIYTLQKQLQTSQRIEALGQLAGGIAHDFNNLLTVFVARIEFLNEEFPDAAKKSKHIVKMLETVKQGKATTQRLLSFTSSTAMGSEDIEVAELITGFIEITERTLPANITVDVAVVDRGLFVRSNRSELEHALLNLVINAKDAMPDGGRISISVRSTERRAANFVELSVSDTGSGMTHEVLEKCINPLFTTKAVGKGSGLGLSMVYSLVTSNGGEFDINSVLNKGTSVTISLPRSNAERVALSGPKQNEKTVDMLLGRVLVIEDNEEIMHYAEKVLLDAGYDVVGVSTAQEVRDRLDLSEHFDLIFSDIMLSGAETGFDLALAYRETCPDIGIVLTTGFAGVVPKSDMLAELGAVYLPKPYTRSEVLDAVRTTAQEKSINTPINRNFA